MKVFISSVIDGFADFRDAAEDAVTTLDHVAIRAEHFGARPDSPQRACLHELRQSDLVGLLLGARYGGVQQNSGLSATHEEFEEAKSTKRILVFVQAGIEPEFAQRQFLQQVQDWGTGTFTDSFSTAGELQKALLKAIHGQELRDARPAVDAAELLQRISAAVERETGSQRGKLIVLLAAGPTQRVVPALAFDSEAMVERLFDLGVAGGVFREIGGVEPHRSGLVLTLEQADGPSVSVSQQCDISVAARAEFQRDRAVIPALVEEDIHRKIVAGIVTAGRVLDDLDPSERLTGVVLQVALLGCGWTPWRSEAEYAKDGGSGTVGTGSDSMTFSPPQEVLTRSAMRMGARPLADELTALLRREKRRHD